MNTDTLYTDCETTQRWLSIAHFHCCHYFCSGVEHRTASCALPCWCFS